MQTAADHQSRLRLLVVDADDAVRSALKRLLDRAGHLVQLASDARSGAVLLASSHFDLVILDLDTFADEGQSLCERLCRPDAWYPILVLSRSPDAGDRDAASHIGRILIKPVDPAVLLQAVEAGLPGSIARSAEQAPEERAAALRRLQARGSRFLRAQLPYRPLYH